MSDDVVDQPPPPSGEDWPARIDQLLGEAEAAPSVGERVDVLCRVAEIHQSARIIRQAEARSHYQPRAACP